MSATRAPGPTEIREARKRAGLTQAAAARLVHVTPRAWQHWELGKVEMPPARWELFTIKARRGAA